MHQELTAHLRLSDRQVIKGKEGESHPHLLAFGKGLAGGFLLADGGVPQLTIGQEGRVILRALPDELVREGGSFHRRKVIVLGQA
ncbi:MAG: hypothetical protein DDT33_01620 [Firmicutes bacterium]|nr:hypothetical protein [Bacillota bacterium]